MTTSQECQKCGGKAQTYLCAQCQVWLRKQLLGMPTLRGHLEDSAVGATRLYYQMTPLGDTAFESRVPTFDQRATKLIEELDGTLYRWAMRMAWKHHYVISPPVTWHRLLEDYQHTASDYCTFLAAHVSDLAKDEYVGELTGALKQYAKRGLALINRREEDQFCGPCPAPVADHRRCIDKEGVNTCGFRPHECATSLMAPPGALEVTCPRCNAVHDVQRLVNHLLAHADDYRATLSEIYRVLRMLGTPVKFRTLEYWAKDGRLLPAGYLRPDNRRIGPTRHVYDDGRRDTPVYRISDARSASADHKPGRGNHVRTEQTREKTRQSVKRVLEEKRRKPSK